MEILLGLHRSFLNWVALVVLALRQDNTAMLQRLLDVAMALTGTSVRLLIV